MGKKRLSEVLSILVLEIHSLRAVGLKLFTIIYYCMLVLTVTEQNIRFVYFYIFAIC